MNKKTIFISADHGLAIVYFLQSEVVQTLLDAGHHVVILSDDGLKDSLQARFGRADLEIEGLRLKEANAYYANQAPEKQWWLNFFRRVGSSNRINTEAMDSYVRQVAVEEGWRRRMWMPAAYLTIAALRRSKRVRRKLIEMQGRYTPRLYSDLFDKYHPDLVVASTPGWRIDRYLLREAAARGINTAAVVVGWDNPSSYSIPGAKVNWINCWSEIQKKELVEGSDWPEERVHIGGIPSYDGYFRGEWLVPREEYFQMHHLDPDRKLLSYAASFVSFAPNYRNVEALARLVASDGLSEPAQLLVRLHPNHFMNVHLYAEERQKIHQLAQELPNVHVVEPVPLGGSLGYYSGEDMPEKTSMMAYSDVFLTVYSTMVVEAAVHERPIVSLCLDTPGGWNWPRKFSLPLTEIGEWPTHSRFRQAKAGKVAYDEAGLKSAVDEYLQYPDLDLEARQTFIRQECTFTDGSAGKHTGEYLLKLLSL
jgi:hypothetical protein